MLCKVPQRVWTEPNPANKWLVVHFELEKRMLLVIAILKIFPQKLIIFLYIFTKVQYVADPPLPQNTMVEL